LKVQEPEIRELRQANKILRKAHRLISQWRHAAANGKDAGFRGHTLSGMRGQADWRGNAVAETVSSLYKAEVIHRRGPWKSPQTVEDAALEWVDAFNNRRLREPIGHILPAKAEQRYHDAVSIQQMTA
jgi:hypothetical protein